MGIISTAEEKWELWEEIGYHCEWCNSPASANDMSVHRHHVLVPKRRLGKAQQITDDAHIDERINIVLVCYNCHELMGGDYEYGHDRQVMKYGIDLVEDFKRRMLPKTHGG